MSLTRLYDGVPDVDKLVFKSGSPEGEGGLVVPGTFDATGVIAKWKLLVTAADTSLCELSINPEFVDGFLAQLMRGTEPNM